MREISQAERFKHFAESDAGDLDMRTFANVLWLLGLEGKVNFNLVPVAPRKIPRGKRQYKDKVEPTRFRKLMHRIDVEVEVWRSRHD